MKLKRLDIVSYEPAVVTLKLQPQSPERCLAIGKSAKEWLQKRRTKACGCEYRFCEIEPCKSGAAVKIQTEWACNGCLEALVAHLAKKYPEIISSALGHAVPVQKKKGHDFIDIPARRVQLENGTWYSVPPFRISKQAVTIGQFETFVQETNYRTVAEREGHWETFRDNQTVSGFSPRAKWTASAAYLAHEDATAYCRHYGYRLPTETEWLSAAVGDWVEVDLTPLQRFALSTAPLPEHLIWVTKPDWVTSAAKNETFFMRSGPLRCLNKGWKKPDELSQHRRVYQKDLYEIWTGFRVVAPVGIDAKPDSLAPKTIRKTVKRAKVSRSQ